MIERNKGHVEEEGMFGRGGTVEQRNRNSQGAS